MGVGIARRKRVGSEKNRVELGTGDIVLLVATKTMTTEKRKRGSG
jgi:hypothetical protein